MLLCNHRGYLPTCTVLPVNAIKLQELTTSKQQCVLPGGLGTISSSSVMSVRSSNLYNKKHTARIKSVQ